MSGAWLKAKMSMDSSGVKAGVGQAQKSVGGLEGQLRKIGPQLAAAFSVAALAGFTKQVIQYASRISDLAFQTSLSTDQFQGFQTAVLNAGGTIEKAAQAIISLRDAQDSALEGDKNMIDAFERLGVSLEDVAEKSVPELLEAVAAGYRSIQDFGAIVDLFGKRNAGQLEEALIALAENGFGGLVEAAKEAGMVMSQEDILKADEMADRFERAGIRIKTFWGSLIFDLVETSKPFYNAFLAYLSGIQKTFWDLKANVKNLFAGNFSEISLNPLEHMMSPLRHAKTIFDTLQSLDKEEKAAFAERTEGAQQKREEKQAKLRASKLAEIYEREEAKLAEKSNKQAEKIKEVVAKSKKEAGLISDKSSAVDPEGPRTVDANFSQLRRIGANFIGSGITSMPVQSDEKRIANATEETATATKELLRAARRPETPQVMTSGASF